PYRTYTDDRYDDDTGMIWSAFRPSDDPVQYRFNVPQNMFAVVALREIEYLASIGYNDRTLVADARALEQRVFAGILTYGRYYDARNLRWMYAYETDGFGRYNLMDDANIPNLTALPYVDWCSAFDPTYLNTRAFTLSLANPFFYSGTYGEGLGSPHTPRDYIWPLGIVGRALTSTSSTEVSEAITTLAETAGDSGQFHESYYANGYWRYTRAEFGWADALAGELLFRTLAGDTATQFGPGGPILPFQTRTKTPVLNNRIEQLRIAGELNATLGSLLHVNAPMPHGTPKPQPLPQPLIEF
ncbi:MAG: glycoside hydrolase family 125 protein, partial [Candidatus Eremiobacteraeota bacterium]|nr:glycoside hydrolase family 125 protein [Candidatus Eremiobacteraeota bacterium]